MSGTPYFLPQQHFQLQKYREEGNLKSDVKVFYVAVNNPRLDKLNWRESSIVMPSAILAIS